MTRRRVPAALLAAALAVAGLVLASDAAYSAGGALDTTFNTSGAATLDFGNGTDSVSDLALQSDGKVVVVGPSGSGFGIARYTTAGALDTTFASSGFIAGSFMTDARDVAIQTDGKIVVVGRSASSNGSLVIARYTTTGLADTTFDADGRATIALTGSNSGAVAVALQSDSKAVVLAIDSSALSVFRFTTAGAIDLTWSGDGRVDTAATPTSTPTLGDRVAVQSDGKVVVTGGGAGPVGGVLRYTTTGTLDTTLDTDGIAQTANHVVRGLAVSESKIVTAGDAGSSDTKVLIARRNMDGSLDSTFGTGGVMSFSVPGLSRASAHAVVLQTDGKLVVSGRLDDSSASSSVFVARLTATGALDTTFATGGIATFTTLANKSTTTADAVAVDSTGRIVVGGGVVSSSGLTNDTDFAVFRVLVTDSTATTGPSGATGATGPSGSTGSSTTTTTLPGETPAGSTARSDPADTAPTASNEIVANVTTPVAGVVTFAKGDGTAVTGYRTLAGVTITAPTGTPQAPLRFTFALNVASMPDDFPLGGIDVLRNDVPVQPCLSATATVASPDPCVLTRTRTGDVLTFAVLSSSASTWKFARPVLQRIAGASRFESAIALSKTTYGDDGAGAVVLVRSDGYADALAATPLAVAEDAPLLLSSPTVLEDATLVEIIRVLRPGGKVFLLGGTGALSNAVADRLLDWGFETVRFAGADRFETAAIVARDGLGSPDVIVETTGLGFADALAAGAVAASLDGAVLLTAGASQTSATLAYITDEHPTRYALGGPAAAADSGATSVAGADRYETAVLAALRFFPTIDAIGFASGTSFADALAGGTHAARTGAPLLLVPPTGVLPVSIDILLRSEAAAPPAAFLYGGTGAVADDVATLLRTALGG
jgi:uncharacterized delta-60 repeat protein